MRERSGHVLATVLFTDIVDSSKLARELGDARWRVLLAHHHAIVRRALKRNHGKEIDNAGDGFFASFPDQVDAIRCACTISDGVRELGIEVRAGCHVGQAEVIGHKLGGVTIHAASRVMSEAGPSEVLISGMVKDLVPASGFGFTDRGERELKGIEGTWHLYAVTAVDGEERPPPLDAEEAARRRESIQAPTLVERRWGRIGIAAAVVAVMVGASLLFFGRSKPPEPLQILPSSVVRIDPATNDVIADVPVAEPGAGQIVAVPPNQVWVLSHNSQVVSIIDTTTNGTPFGPVPVGMGGQAGSEASGFGMVSDFGSVYVAPLNNGRIIERFDPGDRTAPPKIFPTPGTTGRLASGGGRLWVPVTRACCWHVVAMDPETGHTSCDAKTDGYAVGYGEGAVWVVNLDFTVSWITPRVGRPTCRSEPIRLPGINGEPSGIGFGFGFVWVADSEAGVVYKIDPTTHEVVKRIAVSDPGSGYQSDIVALDGSMWVASPATDTIERINPVTDKVDATIHLAYAPQDLVVANGSLWATVSKFPCCSF
jgi:class 3 adenylate cyclase